LLIDEGSLKTSEASFNEAKTAFFNTFFRLLFDPRGKQWNGDGSSPNIAFHQAAPAHKQMALVCNKLVGEPPTLHTAA